jgi:phage FluMu protein Com
LPSPDRHNSAVESFILGLKTDRIFFSRRFLPTLHFTRSMFQWNSQLSPATPGFTAAPIRCAEGPPVPIVFNCRCGKTLRVTDEHANRRIKCPACGHVGTVPAPAPQFEEIEDTSARTREHAPPPPLTPAAKPPARGPSDPIVIECPCGMTLGVPADHAGRRVKCPKCNAISTAPKPEPEFEVVENAAGTTVRFVLDTSRPRLGEIAFRCSCGRVSRVLLPNAGRRMQCPGCKGIGVVPKRPQDEDDEGTYKLGPPVPTLDNPTGRSPRGRPGLH